MKQIGARFYSMFDAGSTHTFNEGIVSRPFFNVDAEKTNHSRSTFREEAALNS